MARPLPKTKAPALAKTQKMLASVGGSTAVAALGSQIHPPSHVETIDPKTALTDPRFRRQGVSFGRRAFCRCRAHNLGP